jgi:uncharacterized protein (TIRG00374 family)
VRQDPVLPLAVLLLTIVLYLNKFTLAWLLMKALGVDGSYLLTVGVQAVLHFILYVAPTPGGSGIAEVSTGALMSLVLPTPLLGPFTMAYRFLLGYLPAAAGAVALFVALRVVSGTEDVGEKAVEPSRPEGGRGHAEGVPIPVAAAPHGPQSS